MPMSPIRLSVALPCGRHHRIVWSIDIADRSILPVRMGKNAFRFPRLLFRFTSLTALPVAFERPEGGVAPISPNYSHKCRSRGCGGRERAFRERTTVSQSGGYNRSNVPNEPGENVAIPVRKSMSQTHKAALAMGRDEGRVVRRYLEALESEKGRQGRRRSLERVERQLADTVAALPDAGPVDRVHLLQRRIDLQEELDTLRRDDLVDLAELEAAFIAALPGYSRRKHLTYVAWRAAGVPARVLRAAGLRRAT